MSQENDFGSGADLACFLKSGSFSMMATRESNVLRERGVHINFVRADWLKSGRLLASLRSVDMVSFGEQLRGIKRIRRVGGNYSRIRYRGKRSPLVVRCNP